MLLIHRLVVFINLLTSLTYAVICYNDNGTNLPRLFMSPHHDKKKYEACIIECGLIPKTRQIKSTRLYGGTLKDVGFRIFYDTRLEVIRARHGCYKDLCNSVDELMRSLREEGLRKDKRSILSKIVLYAMERTIIASQKENPEFDTPFVICVVVSSMFAVFAFFHLIAVLCCAPKKSPDKGKKGSTSS
ncbi:hypothetical protein RB195_008818 [Necator americanus]|uniref:Transthyretin-like family protein n=1 Tax=Necator americanus TaxID=51031 RepID=A0ABR1CQJ3_NECAM